jgi:hypothetical protein
VEDAGFMISAFDRTVATFKSLKVSAVLSDFEALCGFVQVPILSLHFDKFSEIFILMSWINYKKIRLFFITQI